MHWKELINVNLPDVGSITEVSRSNAKRYDGKFRGSVRISLGKFQTDAEHEERRRKLLNTPLP